MSPLPQPADLAQIHQLTIHIVFQQQQKHYRESRRCKLAARGQDESQPRFVVFQFKMTRAGTQVVFWKIQTNQQEASSRIFTVKNCWGFI